MKMRSKICAVPLFLLLLPMVKGNTETSFHRVSVSATRLAAATSEEYFLVSKIVCAHLAVIKDWSKLFCYADGQCQLYWLSFSSAYVDTDLDVVNCYTKYGPQVPCPNTFTFAEGMNCMKILAYHGTYNSAQADCQTLGGSLASPGDHQSLVNYLLDKTAGIYWVGAYNQRWLSGRNIAPDEWDSGHPTNAYPCANLHTGPGFTLREYPCSSLHWSLCQVFA